MNYEKIARNLKRNPDKRVIRKLKDMKGRFQNYEKVKEILNKKNPVIYRVYRKEDKNEKTGNIKSLTVIYPGCIGKEYFMTKGHKHKKRAPERYILVKGKGILLLQKDKCKKKELIKNKEVTISGKEGHRLVNIGKLEVITIEYKETEKDYDIIFKKRILK